jgi:hypothetical protein
MYVTIIENVYFTNKIKHTFSLFCCLLKKGVFGLYTIIINFEIENHNVGHKYSKNNWPITSGEIRLMEVSMAFQISSYSGENFNGDLGETSELKGIVYSKEGKGRSSMVTDQSLPQGRRRSRLPRTQHLWLPTTGESKLRFEPNIHQIISLTTYIISY